MTVPTAGCTFRNGDGSATDFFPLHADDTWIYEVARPLRNLRTRMTVRVRGEHYVPSLRRRCRLVDESYAGNDAELEGSSAGGGKAEIYPIAYYHENGFWYRALSLLYSGSEVYDVGLGSVEERFLPDGLGLDLSWDSVTTAYDLGGGNGYDVRQTHRALPEPRLIEVPAGRFTGCIRVDTMALHSNRRDGQYDSAPIVLYYSDWYAPNVGLIRSVQSNRNDGEPSSSGPFLSQIELIAYDVERAGR
ncbi:MAG: hypothetical protein ACHQ9S_02900 [Candidatus Binatia bacterium]